MNRSWSVVLLILLAISFTLSCGSSPRQLQNITIAQTTNGQQVQFVATGTFSASPRTVTPLPVDWTMGLMAHVRIVESADNGEDLAGGRDAKPDPAPEFGRPVGDPARLARPDPLHRAL